jgi:hypothetical protein
MFCVGAFEFQSHARPRQIRMQLPFRRLSNPLEKHAFDAHMVMKVLEVADWNGGATHMRVQGGSSMRRQRQMVRLAQRGNLEKAGDAAAARGISLHYVHGAGFEQASKIEEIVAIFTGCNLHSSRHPMTQEPQSFEIVGGNWFFKPANARLFESFSLRERLLAGVSAVCVHKELRGRANRLPRPLHAFLIRLSIASDFHLDARDTLFDPTQQLCRQSLTGYEVKPPLP